jgi:hypothetical protein
MVFDFGPADYLSAGDDRRVLHGPTAAVIRIAAKSSTGRIGFIQISCRAAVSSAAKFRNA